MNMAHLYAVPIKHIVIFSEFEWENMMLKPSDSGLMGKDWMRNDWMSSALEAPDFPRCPGR